MTGSSSHRTTSLGARGSARRFCCLLLALPLVACGAYKNKAEREQAAREERDAAADAGVAPKNPAACVRTCAPDPGSRPVNCEAAERGVEFMSTPIWDYEDGGVDTSYLYYKYTDGSVPSPNSAPNPYVKREDVERCGKTTRAVHVAGGPFISWGGGIGVSAKDWLSHVKGNGVCTSPGQPAPCESPEAGYRGVRTVDASQWDGISLWARRGPESQVGFRVTTGDKYTDDDLNVDPDPTNENDGLSEQKFCKRYRQCNCPSNRPCNSVVPLNETEPVTICYDPRYDTPPRREESNGVVDLNGNANYIGERGERYYLCGETACAQNYQAGGTDPAFQGKACTDYAFENGTNGSFCFDPGEDPPPAENYERCGDHWQSPVRLSTDWQLFLVPFADMRQQGYGKESPRLLTSELSIFRFTWEAGYVDYYIDDVRFYRVTR